MGGKASHASGNPGNFANRPKEEVQEIASKGGKAAHASGHAHEFTSEEARAAGSKRHANRAAANTDYYKRGQYIPGLKINGMDVLAVKAAVQFGKEFTRAGKGPLVFEYVTYRYGGHSMSDPGTTYRTREEIQRMRSTNDPIAGLKQKLLDWGVTTEKELKAIDKEARSHVDEEVAAAEAMAVPDATPQVLFEDIYVRGSEPPYLRGRTPEETFYYTKADIAVPKEPPAVART